MAGLQGMVFMAAQYNGVAFRAQMERRSDDWLLWVTEGDADEDCWCTRFTSVLSSATYKPSDESLVGLQLPPAHSVLLLVVQEQEDGEDVSSLKFGKLTEADAHRFLAWMSWRMSVKA